MQTRRVPCTESLGVYDGTVDWKGASGYATPFSADDAVTLNITSASDLSLFTGSGNVSLPVQAQAASQINGSGNVTTLIAANASATVSAVYTYTTIPEPAGFVALATGLIGLGGVLLRRRS